MATFYRIQPAGKGIQHQSENSAGEATSLHVFDSAEACLNCEGKPTDYGNEVVEIEAVKSWGNGDVEGVAIDGRSAKIVARYTLDQFAAKVCPEVAGLTADEINYSLAYQACPLWYAAIHR